MPEATEVTLTEAGKATFGPITYTEADAGKTYSFDSNGAATEVIAEAE